MKALGLNVIMAQAGLFMACATTIETLYQNICKYSK